MYRIIKPRGGVISNRQIRELLCAQMAEGNVDPIQQGMPINPFTTEIGYAVKLLETTGRFEFGTPLFGDPHYGDTNGSEKDIPFIRG